MEFLCVAMVKKVSGAKIALLHFPLQKANMAFGIYVLVDEPEKLNVITARWAVVYVVCLLTLLNLSFISQGSRHDQ
jgi:hypothetical protein